MIRRLVTVLAWAAAGAAAPTWPSPTDELEDIMLLNTGYRARGFSVAVTPCSFSAQGPGRVAAAEWVRTAFHDMATGNVFTGLGGLDASIVFEIGSGENIGSAFITTVTTFAPFLSSRSSMADLIALGVHTAVRSCGGPAVPIRTGRIDATSGGPIGVPLPQNSLGTFQNQFLRVGFDTPEMIAVVACGHTLGGVHAVNFPTIVIPGTAADDFQRFDGTDVFDSRVAADFVAGTTTNPLVVGPSRSNGRDSDRRIFMADGNVTIAALVDPVVFASTCSTVLQKMIEVVPSGTDLTNPIVPYDIKPYATQLTLLEGGSEILFTGEIRVRTTVRPASQIASVQLLYKDRTGGNDCGSCTIDTVSKGTAAGFDDSFTFYGFSFHLPSQSSISAFNVLITLTGGATELYDNNGGGFAVQDSIMLQSPQSCLSLTDGKVALTIVAAVRNPPAASPTLTLTLKVPRNGVVVPGLQTADVPMTSQSAVGSYDLYVATYSLDPSQAQTAKFDVSIGSGPSRVTDDFKDTGDLPSACTPLGTGTPTPTSSSQPYVYQGCYTETSPQRALTGAASSDVSMTIAKCAVSCSNFLYFGLEYAVECYCGNSQGLGSKLVGDLDCSMPCPGNSQENCGAGNRLSVYKNLEYVPPTNPTLVGYTYQGCYSETAPARALSDSSTASDSLTVQMCATFCNGATYFGVEYGRECYCGASLSSDSAQQPQSDCSSTCAGDNHQFCGAGNRIDLYKKTPTISSSSTTPEPSSTSSSTTSSSPTTPEPSSTGSSTATSLTPTLSGYNYQGCQTDAASARLLTGKSTANNAMSHEVCATYCSGYDYFGVEYGSECYCGDSLANPTSLAPESDCSSPCSGNPTQNCGSASRMNLFKSSNLHPAPLNPTILGYTYANCHTDSVSRRVLTDRYLGDGAMTVEMCATFCNGYSYFGTQYGIECFCGNAFSNPTIQAPESECGYVCGGNSTEFCGAANRLSLYAAQT